MLGTCMPTDNAARMGQSTAPSQGFVGAALLKALIRGPQLLQSRRRHADRALIRPPECFNMPSASLTKHAHCTLLAHIRA